MNYRNAKNLHNGDEVSIRLDGLWVPGVVQGSPVVTGKEVRCDVLVSATWHENGQWHESNEWHGNIRHTDLR